jgi:hypothetical protein
VIELVYPRIAQIFACQLLKRRYAFAAALFHRRLARPDDWPVDRTTSLRNPGRLPAQYREPGRFDRELSVLASCACALSADGHRLDRF